MGQRRAVPEKLQRKNGIIQFQRTQKSSELTFFEALVIVPSASTRSVKGQECMGLFECKTN
jgi:hypothetical protein